MTFPLAPSQSTTEDLPLHQITDHKERALARLLTQFKEKPVLATLIGIYQKTLQEVEDMFWDLRTKRALAVAEGEQLDVIGRILVEPRGPLDDDDYRVVLQIKIRVLKSSGTAEELMAIARLVIGDGFTFREYPPAAAAFHLDEDPTTFNAALLARFLKKAKSGGVRLDVTRPGSDDPLRYAGADGLGGSGFYGSAYEPGSGATYSGVIT